MHEMVSSNKAELDAQALQGLLKEASTFSIDDERLLDAAGRAKALAESLTDPASLLESCLLLSSYYLTQENYVEVIDTLEPLLNSPLDLCHQTRARLLFPLVNAYCHLEEVAKVLRFGTEALKLYQAEGDVTKQAQLHDYLGDAFIRFSAFHEALEHHLAQLELLKSQGANLAEPYAGIGWVHCQMGDFKNALTFLQEGLARARAENNELVAGRCLGNMANVYDHMKDYSKALSYHRQAIDAFEARDDFRRAMIGYGNVGKTYFDMGDIAQALVHYDKALTQLRQTPNQAFEGWVFIQMAEALLETDAARAESYLHDGLAKLTEAGSNEGTEQAHHLLFKLYELQGDTVKALEHYKSYAEFQIRQLKDLNEKRTQALSIQFEVERLQQEQEIYQLKNVELARAVDKLEELSMRDSLTGLYNRRYLDKHLREVFIKAQATQQPLSVLISDIDNFKTVNDTFSHAMGDEVLRIVAQIFDNNTWGADVVARYGGEEFVILLKETPLEEALHIAEKLRQRVEHYPWHELHPDLVITLSTGLCNDLSLENHEKMLSVADDKLYEAKHSGKNRVIV